jgi:Spy/CpxP family protein refolding chaperone
MKLYRPLVLPLVLAGLALAGCGASPDPESTTASAQEPLNAPAGEGAQGRDPKMHGRGGPMMIFHEALSSLDLTADQKSKIQGALDAVKAEHAPGDREGGRALFADVSAQVRAGKIDEAAIQAKLDELKADHQGDREGMASALQTLHDTLTKDQRTKLVASMRAKMEEHERAMGDRHEAHGPPPDGAGPPFLHGLDLKDDQKAKIDKALADAGIDKPEMGKARFDEMRAKMKAGLDAFAADTFDAKAEVAKVADGGPRDHMGKMVKALAVIVPLLDDAQRQKLADHLAEGPMRGHHRGGPEGEPPPGAN